MHIQFIPAALASLALSLPLAAAEFDFKDPKGVNTIVFVADSVLEPIMGFAKDISGTVSHDAAGATKGKIQFPTKSLVVASERMTGVMHGPDWLNAEENENVSFDFTFDGKAFKGTLTLAGVSKSFSAPGSVALVADGAKARGAGEGDLLVLRSKFKVNRSDFGIKPGVVLEKVGNDIDITVAIVGYPAP